MKTELFDESGIPFCADLIREGKLVAVPTETVYGLAGNGLDEEAVKSIFRVKGRPSNKPISLLVHDKSALDRYCENVPEQAYTLADAFFPGPLTIVLQAKSFIPDSVRAGGTTVGLRCPDHELTLKLIEAAGVPLAAPSANPSTLPSPKDAASVKEYFDGSISAILDGGVCEVGTESTLIEMDCQPYKIVRSGALPYEVIADALADKMEIIGITGGSGTGKTTVMSLLDNGSTLILDCDCIYHELLNEKSELNAALTEAFPGCINDFGLIDTKALGRMVFDNKEKLEFLNNLTHSFVLKEVRRRLRDFAMNGGTRAIVDAYALFESGADKICSCTIGVLADLNTRIMRIVARDNISEEYAASRIKSQHSNDYYLDRCSVCLYNNDSIDNLKEKIKSLFLV